MEVTRQNLAEHFRLLSDDELLGQFRSGELTDLAKEVAGLELRERNIDCSQPDAETPVAEEPAEDDAAVDAGDLVLAARYSTAAEAYLLQARLELEGVPAVVADSQIAQNLVPPAIGGVRVLVPESYLARAREIALGVEKGDFALDDADEEKQVWGAIVLLRHQPRQRRGALGLSKQRNKAAAPYEGALHLLDAGFADDLGPARGLGLDPGRGLWWRFW
jgi:Putative prokaryotic signal transducing protein